MIRSLRHALRLAAPLAALLTACETRTAASGASSDPTPQMNQIAESYVRLVLALGTHDADYVDAYYGPPGWRAQADSTKPALATIGARADSLIAALGDAPSADTDEMVRLRHAYLVKQLGALRTRVDMLGGKKLTFDEESRALYDAVAPTHDEAFFQRVLDSLATALPGSGALPARYEAFRKAFVIAPAKLDTVFKTAIAACRERTARRLTLPPGESFTVEYVTGKSWSGYNWYQGNFRSLIQVNTDLPIYIDRAVDLACHEGYPGHHVYNVLLEKSMVRDRGWIEFSVYPLFSPQSLIAEGSANYGIEMAFPGDERITYEREQLFPLAGLDTARAAEYYRVQELVEQLTYAGNEAARRYLNGEIDAKAAADWMVRYELRTPASAAQRVRFIDQYRSYVINYNLGKDLVREYVERSGSTADERWRVFSELLSSPRLPSGLSR